MEQATNPVRKELVTSMSFITMTPVDILSGRSFFIIAGKLHYWIIPAMMTFLLQWTV